MEVFLMKVGIPRALGYYNYYPFWFGFFQALGVEVISSNPTTKQIISKGSALVVSETCLPVKVFIGHILNLLEKGVDAIYVPSIQSIEHKIYNCSKLRGLPDLVRNVVKKDFLLIEPTLDKSQKDQGFYEYLKESVEPLGITDLEKIKEASKKGWEYQNNFNRMLRSGVEFEKALKTAILGQVIISQKIKEAEIKVAVIAHGYNLHDNQVSMKAIQKLEKMGIDTFTPEMLTLEQKEEGFKTLETKIYWANEYEMTGAAGYYMNDKEIDGIITITAFGCGPDSIMVERISRFSKRLSKPLLNLTVDEHTGEAGFITRLEAFCDMLIRRKRSSKAKIVEPSFKKLDKKKFKIKVEI
jgi:predicted nucleotide-binding protein (sugar kinase/HSP70/actin superfamily)